MASSTCCQHFKQVPSQKVWKTAYQQWKGKAFKRAVPEFGERVLFLRLGYLKERKRDKGDTSWVEGHFLGIRDETGELIIGNEEGVVKARDFKRLADPQQRWTLEKFNATKGHSLETKPRSRRRSHTLQGEIAS